MQSTDPWIAWLEWRFPGDKPWAERMTAGRRRVAISSWLLPSLAALTATSIAVPYRPEQYRSTSTVTALGLLLLAVGIWGGAQVWWNRGGARATFLASPYIAMTREQRIEVSRILRRRVPVAPHDVAVMRWIGCAAGPSTLPGMVAILAYVLLLLAAYASTGWNPAAMPPAAMWAGYFTLLVGLTLNGVRTRAKFLRSLPAD